MAPRKHTEDTEDQKKLNKSKSTPKKRKKSGLLVGNKLEISDCEPFDVYEGEKLLSFLNISHYTQADLSTEEISTDVKDKIESLDIVDNWHIPILHRVSTRLSNTPNKKQRELFEDNAIEVRTGLFNPKEDEIIKKNFKNFCAEYHFDEDPIPFLLPQKVSGINFIQRKKFFQYLAKDLPDRMLCSVYNRFHYLYNNLKNGRFTAEEDALILDYVKNCDHKLDVYVKLSKKLNRHRHSIFKRYKYLTNTKVDIKQFTIQNEHFQWDNINIKTLVSALMEVLEVNKIEDLKNVNISKQTWTQVADKTNIPASRIRAFWETKLSTQFFAEQPIYLSSIRRDIITYFLEKNYKYWEDICWKTVAKDFHGVQPLFLFLRTRSMVKTKVPKALQADVKAAMNYLKDHFEEEKYKKKDSRLVRLRVSSKGKIKKIRDD